MAGFLADTESFWDAGMKAIAQHAVVAAELLRREVFERGMLSAI
jgi:hypothetical protein